MASLVGTEKFTAENAVISYDHDPGGTTATIITPDGGTTDRWVDMRDYDEFTCAIMVTIATGGATKLEIVAADDTSGTNTVVIKDSGTVAADAVGDFVVQSCNAKEIAHLSNASGYSSRYVAGRLTCSNAGDEAVATYIRSEAKHAQSGLTANAIA